MLLSCEARMIVLWICEGTRYGLAQRIRFREARSQP
jgi:hypothetical protein